MKTTKTYTLVITETIRDYPPGFENRETTYSYTIVKPDGTSRCSMGQLDEFNHIIQTFEDVLKGKD